MAAQTIFSWLLTWAQGDRPGAGSQVADSNGLNGQWWKTAEKFNVLFYLPSNILRDQTIGPEQLKLTCGDGVSIEQDGDTGKLRVKDGGLTAAKFGTGSVTGEKLNSNVAGAGLQYVSNQLAVKVDNVTLMAGINGLQIKTLPSEYAAIDWADEVTLTQDHNGPLLIKDGGVGPQQLANDAVTAPKISHDNTARKNLLIYGFVNNTPGTQGGISGVSTNILFGYPMRRGGYITRMNNYAITYGNADFRFEAGNQLAAWVAQIDPYIYTAFYNVTTGKLYTGNIHQEFQLSGAGWLTVEVEFDD